jgi:hypothetical protein
MPGPAVGQLQSRAAYLAWVDSNSYPESGPPEYDRGYARLYLDHVQQAHVGADFDFLVGSSGAEVRRESH